MVRYWPDTAKSNSGGKAEKEFAEAFDSVSKIVVFSKTLEKVEGKNTEIVYGNLCDTILQLKKEQGKDILTGGVTIPSQLIGLGMIDEYHFVVHPIVAGHGRRLFDVINLSEQLKLKLVASKIFKSGCIGLHYVKQ